MQYTYRYRSFFWPAVLILAGVVALLVNTGRIPVDRIYLLLNLWPLILVVIGAELIIRRSVHGPAGDAAAALIVVLAIAGSAGYVAFSPSPVSSHTLDTSGAKGSLDHGALEVDVGAAMITIQGSDLGDRLYAAHIEYSGPKPDVNLDSSTGALRIAENSPNGPNFPFFQNRRFILDLKLSTAVPWTITENSGATTDSLRLSHLRVVSLTLNTGASRDDITLGDPSGIVSVTINGGALTANLHRPNGVAASVDVSGGAISLNADGHEQHGIGSVSYQSFGFTGASDGYRFTVNGGATTVTLDTSGG